MHRGHVHEVTSGESDVAGDARALLGNRFLGDLHQDFLAFFQKVTNRRQLARSLEPAAAHPPSSAASMSVRLTPATALRLLVTGSPGSNAMLGPSAFQFFFAFNRLARLIFFGLVEFSRYSLLLILLARHGVEALKKLIFWSVVRGFICSFVESFLFIPAGGAFVDVCIANRLSQFPPHGNQTLISGTEHLFFKLVEFRQVQIFFKAGKIAFFFFNLLLFHNASRCSAPGLGLDRKSTRLNSSH